MSEKTAPPPERNFYDDWKQGRHVYIAECTRCGFECFVGADATIEEHDRKHTTPTPQGPR